MGEDLVSYHLIKDDGGVRSFGSCFWLVNDGQQLPFDDLVLLPRHVGGRASWICGPECGPKKGWCFRQIMCPP